VLTETTKLNCPYCGEPINMVVDYSAGSQSYVEDCEVCCRPIEVSVVAGPHGLEDVTLTTDYD